MQQASIPFANDGSFFETFQKLQQQQGQTKQSQQEEGAACVAQEKPDALEAEAVAVVAPKEDAIVASTSASEQDYIQAAHFRGAKEGFAFKMGDDGLGYYKDVPLHKRKPALTKPVVLKSKSIIKVPVKAAPAGGNKKRKLGVLLWEPGQRFLYDWFQTFILSYVKPGVEMRNMLAACPCWFTS
jgi:hypothetical protein